MTSLSPILAAAPAIRRHTLNDKAKRKVFARAVTARRMELKMKRPDFAKAIGISYKQTAHIENADHWPSLPVYEKICSVLKVGPVPLMK